MKKIWINHQLLPTNQAKVSALDRGFLYGDGVYEAVRVYQGKIFRGDGHWKRLAGSLKAVHMRVPWTGKFLTDACLKTAKANGMKEALVRVTISRGVGEIGYDPRTAIHPTLTVMATPVRADLPELWKKGVKIAVVKIRRNHVLSLNPAIKHTNALNGILAKIEALKVGAFEGVFLNLDGFVAEGTISNIFLIKNGIVKTPALSCGILDGVTRRAILEVARGCGLRVAETDIPEIDLYRADEIFLTSTTMEAMPVVRIQKRKVGSGRPGPVTALIQKKFRGLLRKELGIDV